MSLTKDYLVKEVLLKRQSFVDVSCVTGEDSSGPIHDILGIEVFPRLFP